MKKGPERTHFCAPGLFCAFIPKVLLHGSVRTTKSLFESLYKSAIGDFPHLRPKLCKAFASNFHLAPKIRFDSTPPIKIGELHPSIIKPILGSKKALKRLMQLTNRQLHPYRSEILVGDGGFEPPKAKPADLQSVLTEQNNPNNHEDFVFSLKIRTFLKLPKT